MQNIDILVFNALTAGPGSSPWLAELALILASDIVPILLLAMVAAWVRARPHWRGALLDAVASALFGLGLVQVIGMLAYRPRPFELGFGANLLHHVPENSFPSDHATLLCAVAVTLCLSPPRRAGYLLLPIAALVGWARIYLGVHWPSDILAGAVLGAACALLIRRMPWRRTLWTRVERLYEHSLKVLHLPPAVFPRQQ